MFRKFVMLLAILCIVAGCSQTSSAKNDAIRFTVTDLKGLEELKRDFGPFQEALSEALDREVKLFPVSDRTAAVSALKSDQVDLVLTGPAEYVIIKEITNSTPLIGISRPGYRSEIAVLADSGINSLSELEGKKIAMSDIGSTSGHIGPSKILFDAGLQNGKNIETVMLGDADRQAFYNGDVAAWGGNPIDLEHFIESNDNISKEDFKVIKEGPILPNDIFIANTNTLTEDEIADIRHSVLENEQTIIDSILSVKANDKYEGTELVEAKDEQYDYVRGAYEAIGVTDLTEFVGD
ncbi:phosphate/phosphite/phosphonate ABC transporter substrate-binding protein [Gracilibacillus sp. YIM 98692]|uniref:phosphate/phosphite/phosphonate ABC transporter substrate-binding protein n=1 Tax=Gracilibacillus sp. YIM 98692 TaxID=2663532 RepID=UPI0013D36D5B|nr:phosphate/phosphite/phosphonate ABC transporter substrate-binding protein [Gracilibacillus sp. YIM 98692]